MREYVGRHARVKSRIETRGGRVIRKGTIVRIGSVWRGRFTLTKRSQKLLGGHLCYEVLVRHIDRIWVTVLS